MKRKRGEDIISDLLGDNGEDGHDVGGANITEDKNYTHVTVRSASKLENPVDASNDQIIISNEETIRGQNISD